MFPADLKYTKDHEWVKVEAGNKVRVGITSFAQQELGDVVFVELPEQEATVQAGDSFAVVESVKAVSDIYSPVGGTIVTVNLDLVDQPELINEDPYGQGWIAIIEMNNPSELAGLMSADAYKEQIG